VALDSTGYCPGDGGAYIVKTCVALKSVNMNDEVKAEDINGS
jgi:hypothetical protein